MNFQTTSTPSEKLDAGLLLNETEVAEIIGAKIGTLRNWRARRCGPAYLKIGGFVRYEPREIKRLMDSGRVDFERPRAAA
ncbi:MAG: helix-turn-helix domain-containing protein [Rhodanobacteraceae bacterium]